MIVSGSEFDLMETILKKCSKRSFMTTLKEWENKHDFCTQQKQAIEKIIRERQIDRIN